MEMSFKDCSIKGWQIHLTSPVFSTSGWLGWINCIWEAHPCFDMGDWTSCYTILYMPTTIFQAKAS